MSIGTKKVVETPPADRHGFPHGTVFVFGILILIGLPTGIFSQACPSTPAHFGFSTNTGGNYSIVVSSSDSTCGMLLCDEIGVFDDELCIGATVYNGTWPIAIVAWKDDTQTGTKDGYTEGSQISFRIWHSGSDVEGPSVPHFTVGNGLFGTGAYASLWLECPDSCCQGLTGNVDGDQSEIIDIGDLTALIDYLFISFEVPECMEEANCDGSIDGVVDIGDLTELIAYLFITFTEPAECL